MFEIILLVLLLQQGERGAEDFSISDCELVPLKPIACIYSAIFSIRPFKMLPVQPPPVPIIEMTFYLWIKRSDGSIQEYKLQRGNHTQMKEIFSHSFYVTSILAYFHGMGHTGKQNWILKSKQVYLNNPIYMRKHIAMSVDYEEYVQDQKQAVLNVELISQKAAEFFNWTSSFIPEGEFYIEGIGHGMGAYIAGETLKIMTQIMNYTPYTILTALDPDYLSLESLNLTARNLRTIDRSMAILVIVVHTSTCSYTPPIEACNENLDVTMGHYDFFPNGGILQTGCTNSTCSKNRAPELLMEQYILYPKYQLLLAFPCENFTSFQNGFCPSCNDGCPFIGETVLYPLPYGKYYLYTNAESLFGRGDDQSRP